MGSLRRSADKDPELAKELKLLDSSSKFLKGLKELKTPSPAETSKPKAAETIESSAERTRSRLRIQAQLFADMSSMMQDMQKSFAEMQADNRQTAAKIHAMNAETADAIMGGLRASHLSQLKQAMKHQKKMVYLLTEVWPT